MNVLFFSVPSDLDSNTSNNDQWTDPYLLEKFASQETRPNNLLLKLGSGTLPMPGHHSSHYSGGGGGGGISSSGTLGRGSGVTMMTMKTTTSGSGLNHLNHHPTQQAICTTTKTTGLSPYFHTGGGGSVGPSYHPTTIATTNLVVANGHGGAVGNGELDMNVIKNMLLANRVPESCV